MFNLFKKNKKVPIVRNSDRLVDLEDFKIFKTTNYQLELYDISKTTIDFEKMIIIEKYIDTYNLYQVK